MTESIYEQFETNSEIGIIQNMIIEMRALAIRALRRMYLPDKKLFAFHIRRTERGDIVEGESRRYTAISLIGLLDEPYEVISQILSGDSVSDITDRLIEDALRTRDMGELALVLWLARVIHHPNTDKLFAHLQEMEPLDRCWPTVELSWLLMALTVESDAMTDETTANLLARQLMLAYNDYSGLFPHFPDWRRSMTLRRHVACFADQVYPIQALSNYCRFRGSQEVQDIVCRCGDRLCSLQGIDGQWWWHYDIRTGRVLEGYPVYSVHQDAMAPMAFFALQEVSHIDYSPWINYGISWLINPSETNRSLIDSEADIIWRKIARHEPNRMVRGLQAFASRIHHSLRVPAVDFVFRPGRIEYESRPYHMGWILYAWPAKRIAQFHSHSWLTEEKEVLAGVDASSHWESWSANHSSEDDSVRNPIFKYS